MPNFENAFKTVCELVKDFKENEHRYLSPQYQEAEVRRDFIDKLFEALGWDVYHRTQKNPYEQEVKVEKGVSIGKAQKRADYAFYINPEYRQPKFFAEAKKPSRSLKNADDYFQTIRYGWNSNTPIAVLTDFEEFHVLDCRYKPNLKTVLDNPNHKSYRYADYTNKEIFKEIYYLFSRDDVEKNSLEKYSEAFAKIKGKGKTTFKSIIKTIDDDFLEYIDEVRETLAKAFKKNDAKLSSEELTEATQRTIDRIVFIRFLEDKLIEPEYYISEFGKKGNAWNEFISVCRKLDAKYNGIVFKKHFIDEQNFQGPEQSTFKKICDEMSYLNSPYDFNAIPIHILGSIYERFLGKVVNATAQRVKVEEKPEVRKAGGVYYTPKYIVDYIVENTVGKILRNEDSNQPRHSREPAKRLAFISGNPEDKNGSNFELSTLNFKLSKTPSQISSLRFADIACGSGSFLIGVFETLLKYHTEYYQHHPDEAKKDGCINKDGIWILSIKQKQNILLNNIYGVDIDNQAVEVTQLSLALKMLEDETGGTANQMQVLFHEKILPDLSKNIVCGNSLIGTDILQGKMFPTEEERKLNPMDFETMFPEVFKQGGFNAIVGNPPYGAELNETERNYLNNKFKVNNTDTAALFMINANRLLNTKSRVGLIIPKPFIYASNWVKVREIILQNLITLVDCSKVWNEVKYEMVIYIVDKNLKSNCYDSFVREGEDILFKSKVEKNITNEFGFIINNLSNSEIELGLKIKNNNKSLNSFVKNERGGMFQKLVKESGEIVVIGGKQIARYYLKSVGKGYIDSIKDLDKKSLIKHNSILAQNIVAHVVNPYPRIIIMAMPSTIVYNNEKNVILDTVNQLSIIGEYSCNFITALLNSKLISWYVYSFIVAKAIRTIHFDTPLTEKIMIPDIDLNEPTNKQSHDKIVSLVDQMLESKKQLQTSKTDKDKTYWERKCEQLDHAIDSEVYKLYNLTPEEIKIVEGKI